MAKPSTIKVLEQSRISPPSDSSSSSSKILPLTFLDIPWLFFSPNQSLFFYEFPYSTSHFLHSILPNLKHSLSLTLQHFFPFLGNLVISRCEKPKIVYNENDSISFIVQESIADFNFIVSYYARNEQEFHPFVPDLATHSVNNCIPLFAVKITVFPHMGICIGLSYQYLVADGRTFNNFIKTWSSLCGNSSSLCPNLLPTFDRSLIKDSLGLEEIFWKELWKRKSWEKMVIGTKTHVDLSNMVRATFVVSLLDMEKIKKWIIGKCKVKNQNLPIHLSPYVLTCSFLWVCLVKAQIQIGYEENEDPNYFAFIAGGLTRLDYPVPVSYCGNCVGFGRAKVIRKELLGDDGIIVAANAMGNMIKKLDNEIFYHAEKWIPDWEVLFGSEIHVMISGSPKVNLYKTDFGWGKPIKIEDIAIDKSRAISLIESRDFEGGIEIGLVLPKGQMEILSSIFYEGLKIIW